MIPVVAINYIWSSEISMLLVSDPATHAYADQFLRISIFLCLFEGMIFSCVDFISIIDRAYINIIVIVITLVFHVLYCWLFIIVFDWGLTGGAIAEVLTNATDCTLGLIYIFVIKPEPECAISPNIKMFEGIWRYLKFTLPILVLECSSIWSGEIINIIAVHMEPLYYSGYMVINLSSEYAGFLSSGVFCAVSILVAKHLGAGNTANAKTIIYGALFINMTIVVLMLTLYYPFREYFIRIFTNNEEVVKIAYNFTLYSLLCLIPSGLATVLGGVFKGIGKQGISSIISFFSSWLLNISLVFVFVYKCNLNIYGILLAGVITGSVEIMIFGALYLSYDFNTLKLEALSRVIQEDHGWNDDEAEEKKLINEDVGSLGLTVSGDSKSASKKFPKANSTLSNS